jgi:hypothetical protein
MQVDGNRIEPRTTRTMAFSHLCQGAFVHSPAMVGDRTRSVCMPLPSDDTFIRLTMTKQAAMHVRMLLNTPHPSDSRVILSSAISDALHTSAHQIGFDPITARTHARRREAALLFPSLPANCVRAMSVNRDSPYRNQTITHAAAAATLPQRRKESNPMRLSRTTMDLQPPSSQVLRAPARRVPPTIR